MCNTDCVIECSLYLKAEKQKTALKIKAVNEEYNLYLKVNQKKTFGLFFGFEAVEEHRKKCLRIIAQRIISVADAPVVQQCSFKERVCLENFVCGNV